MKESPEITVIRHYLSCSASSGRSDALSFTPALVLHHVNKRLATMVSPVSLSRCTPCSGLNILRYAITVGQNYSIFLLFIQVTRPFTAVRPFKALNLLP